MAKRRFINTKFWSDDFIVGLSPLARYLFLYLLTNEHTDICGIYEMSWRVMERETGLKVTQLQKLFEDLKGKIYYLDGWIYTVNTQKHLGESPLVAIGVERSMSVVPPNILAKIKEIDIQYDRVSIHSEQLAPSLSPSLTPVYIDLEKQIEPLRGKYAPSVIEEFLLHWGEKNSKGKERWQLEKTWEIEKRLAKWQKNKEKWEYEKSLKGMKPVQESGRRELPAEMTNAELTAVNF